MPNLKLTFAGFACTPPLLVSATNSSLTDFNMTWNYQGVNHALYDSVTTVKGEYSLDGGTTWTGFTEEYDFPIVTGAFTAIIEWTVIHIRLYLYNSVCNVYSNTIIIDIT